MVNNKSESEDSESDSSSSDDESDKSGSDTEADSTPDMSSIPEVNLIEEVSNNHEPKSDEPKHIKKEKEIKNEEPKKSNLDLLLDLDDLPSIGQSIMTPSLGGFLTPIAGGGLPGPPINNKIELVGPSWCPIDTQEMLNKVNGYGLGIRYKYSRSPHLFSASMISLELHFTNHKEGNVSLEEIQVIYFDSQSSFYIQTFLFVDWFTSAPQWNVLARIRANYNFSSENFPYWYFRY